MPKSLLPDEVRAPSEHEEPQSHDRSKTLVEVLHEAILRKHGITPKWWRISAPGRAQESRPISAPAADYSRMNYQQLREIADNDAIADVMPTEEYESLSIELWKKFSLEKLQ